MKVRCANCGKVVPYAGSVCPYCNADKSDAKKKLDFITYWGVGSGLATFIASLGLLAIKGGPPSAAFCFAFFGAIAGGVIGSVVGSMKKNS